jgi:hypothetical protein
MAARGTYLDPQAGLLLETYLQYKDRYLAAPYYREGGFAAIKGLIRAYQEFIKRAESIAGLKIVYGTDAVAGAHGRNAEDFINRVRYSGVDPMAAMVSATSLGAEALGMADRIGSIASGRPADIIALDGDSLKDITAVRRVVFVMKGSVVLQERCARRDSGLCGGPALIRPLRVGCYWLASTITPVGRQSFPYQVRYLAIRRTAGLWGAHWYDDVRHKPEGFLSGIESEANQRLSYFNPANGGRID